MLKNILILLLMGTLAYVFMDNQEKVEQIDELDSQIGALNHEIEELRQRMGPTAANVPRAGQIVSETSSPAGMTVQNVNCSLCRGTGKVTRKSLSGFDRSYPCTACGGRGSKDVQLPAGAKICSTCRGIGRVADLKAMSGLGRCDSCRGIGYTR